MELLEECAEILEKAERYELLGELYRLIIPIYERRRAFVVSTDFVLTVLTHCQMLEGNKHSFSHTGCRTHRNRPMQKFSATLSRFLGVFIQHAGNTKVLSRTRPMRIGHLVNAPPPKKKRKKSSHYFVETGGVLRAATEGVQQGGGGHVVRETVAGQILPRRLLRPGTS